MIAAKGLRARFARAGLLLLVTVTTGGCASLEWRRGPAPSSAPTAPVTVAVAPAMNLSGSTDFEPLRVADLMASELTQVPGVRVIGVNRVLAVLSRENQSQITSPAQAVRVARELGADVILVFAITEYDPFSPPVVGVAAQLYAVSTSVNPSGWDPVTASRSASPTPVRYDLDDGDRPRAENQHVFNAAHRRIAKDVLRFADERNAGRSPFGSRLYLVSQEHFLRYCCYTVGRELLDRYRRAGAATASETEPTG